MKNLTAEAPRLAIDGLEGCDSIDLKHEGELYGTIYAPKADVVFFNSLEMTGALVATNFIQKSSALFHYDADLRKYDASELGLRFVVERWTED